MSSIVRTTISHQSLGSRTRQSCGSLIFSPILFVGAVILLWWNEKNSIDSHRALHEGERVVVNLPTYNVIHPDFENKLVHVTGPAMAREAEGHNSSYASSLVYDHIFGVSPSHVLKLKRFVQMYQWVENQHSETTKHTGGSATTKTTTEYHKSWESKLIDSSTFPTECRNPTAMKFETVEFDAQRVTIGAYTLSDSIVTRVNWFMPYQTDFKVDHIVDASIRGNVKAIENGFYYGSGNQNNPEIGDAIITFSIVGEQTISIVAKQVGDTFGTYKTSSGRALVLVEQGTVTSDEMFQHAEDEATLTTWILRFVGFVLIAISVQLVIQPLVVVLDILPLVGDLAGNISIVVSLCISAVVSTVIIAVAWLFYRPLISIPILGVVFGGIWYFRRKTRDPRQAGVAGTAGYELPPAQGSDLELYDNKV